MGSSVPDVLIARTTSVAFIAFGIIFFDDALIMGRTMFALGILIAVNEALRMRAEATGRCRCVRLLVALAYMTLVLIGFLFPPGAP